jgi:lipopolysaccharide biosynthesis glycosyltransferase
MRSTETDIQTADNPSGHCFATVTTDSFIPGTLVTVGSFLRHNSWFKGDIVIIHSELDPEYRNCLSDLSSQIKFLQVNPQLQDRINEVVKVFPEFASRQARFYSLETFRLQSYEKVMFADSDLLFRRSIEDLFGLWQPLIACGDGAYYNGRGRLWRAGPDASTSAQVGGVLHNTFNSGLFLVNSSLLTDEHYSGLLDLVDSRIYKTPNMKLADQVVLNLYFEGQQHLISATYNYLLTHRAAIYESEKLSLIEARVLHFNGRAKPWLAHEILNKGRHEPALIKACALWFESYLECIQRLHLKRAVESASALRPEDDR